MTGPGGAAVPEYLARYRARRAASAGAGGAPGAGDGRDATPLHLRRVRGRGVAAAPTVEFEGAVFTPALAGASGGPEIAAPPERRTRERFVREISLIRHGITQGYSTDAGLTPTGGWQARRRGHELSRRWDAGDTVRLVHAETNRARETAERLYDGATDGLAMWGVPATLTAPAPVPELRNFGVWTPDGVRELTSAYRLHRAMLEELERTAVGERPRWLVEIDRFYRVQLGGGDPIRTWLTVPMTYFEPPALCVRRFWRGLHRLMAEHPGDQRIVAATHSGPMRAFATWAHGDDPGEPLNVEEIRILVREGGRSALVSYRNRVSEVEVPPPGGSPRWEP